MGVLKSLSVVLKRSFQDKQYFKEFLLTKFAKYLPDEWYLKRLFFIKVGYPLNLDNPVTYNEKLQWLKLYDKNPLYPRMVDKVAVKDYVSSIIGNEYIIPTIGVWDKVEDIDWESLPNQFVLKCSHDSGGLVICRDKSQLDIDFSKKKLESSLKTDFYLLGREYPYRYVPKRIIAEKYLEDKETRELRDYKFFCFDGKVRLMFIASDRQNREEPYFDFYDNDFNHLELIHGHPNAPVPPQKPKNFDKMINLAEQLAKGMPHVRIDFYEVNGSVYFGEITLYHHCGFVPFQPNKWDTVLGEMIHLPQ